MARSEERTEQELAVLRLMYAVSIWLGDEMERVSGKRLGHADVLAPSLINTTPGLSQSDLGVRDLTDRPSTCLAWSMTWKRKT